ncbi:MAG: hypothetical protein L0241_29510 [Planctomycetia bacterium]|nr:hypothetical protein [Planctomycetia bacterium]
MRSPDQKKRLDQLVIQLAAANSLESVLAGTSGPPEIAKALALTPEQQKNIRGIANKFTQLAVLIREERIGVEKQLDVRRKLRDQLDERIVKQLTDAQRAKWKELTGDPFPGLVKAPVSPTRGGFGGGGSFRPFSPFGP